MILTSQKLIMIESFILYPDSKYTASQIAKNKKLNQKSAQLFLDSLEKQGILQSHYEGKNKLFGWNKNNKQIVRQFILAIENLRTIEFYQQNTIVKQIIDKIYPCIKGSIILFGSFADNSQTSNSDIDLLFIGKYDTQEINEICKLYNVAISIKHMKKYESNTLTKEVQKKHILIKNAESYINKAIQWIN